MPSLTPTQADQVEAHVGHVRRLARRLCRQWPQHIDVHEVEQLGYTGLIAAVQRYTPGSGASVWTFAEPRVRGAIVDGLRRSSWPRRLRLDRLLLADPATTHQVPQSRRAQVERVESLTGLAPLPDTPTWIHGGCGLTDPHASLVAAEIRERVRSSVATLNARERRILIDYYWGDRTQLQIARSLGVTEGRISQLHKRALARLAAALSPSNVSKERAV